MELCCVVRAPQGNEEGRAEDSHIHQWQLKGTCQVPEWLDFASPARRRAHT